MRKMLVALLARAWIEIYFKLFESFAFHVALLARAWIEIHFNSPFTAFRRRRSPCESVD